MVSKKGRASGGGSQAQAFFTEDNWHAMKRVEDGLEKLKILVKEEGIKAELAEVARVFNHVKRLFYPLYRKYGELVFIEDYTVTPVMEEYGPAVKMIGKKNKLSKKRTEELLRRQGIAVFTFLPGENEPWKLAPKEAEQNDD